MSPADDALDHLAQVLPREYLGSLATVRDALKQAREERDELGADRDEYVAALELCRERAEAAEAVVARLTLVAENRYEVIGQMEAESFEEARHDRNFNSLLSELMLTAAEAEVRRLTEGLREIAEMERWVQAGPLIDIARALIADSPPEPS